MRLSIDKGKGEKGILELHEVLFLPRMRVNIFSLQRIRDAEEKEEMENIPYRSAIGSFM